MKNDETQLIEFFQEHLVLTIEDLKNFFHTFSRMTIFRKLKPLSYKTSYSHCGRYYTLDTIARYNRHGIWGYNQIYFSKYGSLKNTTLHHINQSPDGFTSHELFVLLKVPVENTVLGLWKDGLILREQLQHRYVYFSIDGKEKQLHSRKQEIIKTCTPVIMSGVDDHFMFFMSLLNEKQRRLFAGYESLRLGHGGDKIIAGETGLNVKTVSRGRVELLNKNIDMDRIRKAGAGRPSLKKTKKF
ncbi:MAG: hypothetical protein K0B11_22880 [Mariniphaga sp.]|nr:hypothetical protein [Mariniphaga sp.]